MEYGLTNKLTKNILKALSANTEGSYVDSDGCMYDIVANEKGPCSIYFDSHPFLIGGEKSVIVYTGILEYMTNKRLSQVAELTGINDGTIVEDNEIRPITAPITLQDIYSYFSDSLSGCMLGASTEENVMDNNSWP